MQSIKVALLAAPVMPLGANAAGICNAFYVAEQSLVPRHPSRQEQPGG